MPPLTISSIDELKEQIGKPIGPSDWVEVTQEDINKFAEVSRDDQWIHVDVERAERESREKPVCVAESVGRALRA